DFNGGRAVVYQGIKNAGIVGVNGEVIVQPSLDRLLEFQEGRGLMRDDKYRFYYITEQTNLYDGYYQQASAFRHGVAVVQIDGKWGIINQKGIEIIPPKYDHIDDFENGYAKVKIEGYNGLSNLDGELIVQPNYEFISYAGEGLFRVEQGDKVGYFDSQGNWVWELNR
ncbi:MAG: WG repeat-containing protein, partial [Bacteroidota bacterium]